MDKFVLFASPWWVNLLILVPVICAVLWRRSGLRLTPSELIYAGLFAVGFGFVEAAVVVYLRAAMGLLPGYQGTLSDVIKASAEFYRQSAVVGDIPKSLLTVEVFREAATMLMLLAVALLAVRGARERWAMFLWMFAIWDITYYAGLWATVRWPYSLKAPDVLFLIPVPWFSQVWFPLLVSGLTVLAVVIGAARRAQSARVYRFEPVGRTGMGR
jgi:hypothetical protein